MPETRKFLVLWMSLILTVCALGVRPAAAITFAFQGTCDSCNPAYGSNGSPITGELILNLVDDMMMPEDPVPGGPIEYAEFQSLTLEFSETANTVTFLPADVVDVGGPIGIFTQFADPAQAAVESLTLFNASFEKIFQFITTEQESGTWLLFETPDLVQGTGATLSLPAVPEPDAFLFFLCAAVSLIVLTHRRAGWAPDAR